MMKSISLAAVIAVTASASFAGSLANAPDQLVQDTAQTFEPIPNPGSGIGAPAIIGGVVAVIAIAALIDNNSSDDTTN